MNDMEEKKAPGENLGGGKIRSERERRRLAQEVQGGEGTGVATQSPTNDD